MVRRLHGVLSAHPAVVPLTVTHRHRSPGVLRWSETVLGILIAAHFDGARRVVALRALLAYTIGAFQLEDLGPLSGQGTVAIAELSPGEFPHMAETARHAMNVSADEEFYGGLAALIRGLTA
jgi:hypothetical protein